MDSSYEIEPLFDLPIRVTCGRLAGFSIAVINFLRIRGRARRCL